MVIREGDVYKLSDFEYDIAERNNTVYNEKTHIVTLFLSRKLDRWIDKITKGDDGFDFDTKDKVLTQNMLRCAERIKRIVKKEKLE